MSYKIIVISDIHHCRDRLERLLPTINSCDSLVFCGDGASDILFVRGRITVPTVCVNGNNDYFSGAGFADSATLALDGAKVFVTHGHKYGVRSGVSTLSEIAELNGCVAAFFGHTHVYLDAMCNGVQLLNPGALCDGSYAIAEYDGECFTFKHCHI